MAERTFESQMARLEEIVRSMQGELVEQPFVAEEEAK